MSTISSNKFVVRNCLSIASNIALSRSISIAFLPQASAAIPVLPLPANVSNIVSPLLLNSSIKYCNNSTGFCVGCILFPIPPLNVIVLGMIACILPSSTLVTYTDGLVEVENNNQTEYGTQKVKKAIVKYPNTSMDELNQYLINDLTKFKQNQPFVDDIAILSCKFI